MGSLSLHWPPWEQGDGRYGGDRKGRRIGDLSMGGFPPIATPGQDRSSVDPNAMCHPLLLIRKKFSNGTLWVHFVEDKCTVSVSSVHLHTRPTVP